jgi:hypothetical protein
MHEREPKIIRQLLERLFAVRARRDREERLSDRWLEADAEMHAIERAIFRVPAGADLDDRPGADGGDRFETQRAG